MRFLIRVVGALIATAVILIAALFLLPQRTIAEQALAQLEAQINRDVSVGSDVSFSVLPRISISASDARISNAPWSTENAFVEAERLLIGVELWPLLSGDVIVRHVEIDGADVFLHQDQSGRANWDFGSGAQSQGAANSQTSEGVGTVEIGSVSIANSRLRYLSPEGALTEVREVNASLVSGPSGDANVAVRATPFESEVDAQLAISDLSGLLNGEETILELAASVAGASIEFDGAGTLSGTGVGSFEADIPSLNQFLVALGQSPNDVSGPIRVSGLIESENAERIALREADVTSDIMSGRVDADLDLSGNTPYLSADISARSIGTPSSGENRSADGRGEWSNAPIDASALGLVDGVIRLNANELFFGDLVFSNAAMTVTIDRARAVAELQNLTAYEGQVTGRFVMNNRNGLSVGGALNATGVALRPLLTATADITRFTGVGNARVEFLGIGNTIDAIMKSLSGSGGFDVGSGTISGIDLDSLFRGVPSGGTTIFDSMTASWDIEGGVLRNRDLLMQLPNVEARGAGEVGLGEQVIDYTLTPELKLGSEGTAIFPVRAVGPWTNPRVFPDLEAMVIQNIDLGDQVDSLQDAAEQAVEDRVREELGISEEEDVTADDVLERVEQELRRSIGNLFGGD